MESQTTFSTAIAAAVLVAFLTLIGVFVCRSYSRLSWKGAAALVVLMNVGAALFFLRILREGFVSNHSATNTSWYSILVAISIVSGAAILGRLYSTWIDRNLTDEEKLAGSAGFRAWFRFGNLFFGILFSISTGLAFEIPIFIVLICTFAAFAAYPLFTLISNAPPMMAEDMPQPPPMVDSNAERDRVLRMLEEEKISPDDGAELLRVIGTGAGTTQPPLCRPQQRFFLGGAILVLFGFLLPWISIDLGKEMSSMMKSAAVEIPGMTSVTTPAFTTTRNYVNGGGIEHGLGWIVLFAGLATSVIWVFGRSIELQTRKMISLFALGIGSIILLYIVSFAFRHLSFGFPVVIVGYVLLGIAVFQKSVVKSPHTSREVVEA